MIYETYCGGDARFKRLGAGRYQKVIRKFFIWWPVGPEIRDEDSMFFPVGAKHG